VNFTSNFHRTRICTYYKNDINRLHKILFETLCDLLKEEEEDIFSLWIMSIISSSPISLQSDVISVFIFSFLFAKNTHTHAHTLSTFMI
jgi:hypothetical protein